MKIILVGKHYEIKLNNYKLNRNVQHSLHIYAIQHDNNKSGYEGIFIFRRAIVQAHILAIVSTLYEKHKVGDLFKKMLLKNLNKKSTTGYNQQTFLSFFLHTILVGTPSTSGPRSNSRH